MVSKPILKTDGPVIRISKAAKECLEIAAITGTIVAVGGGYWVSSQATERQRRELVQGTRTSSAPVAHVGTRTVYSCEALGLLKRGYGKQHKALRTLTDNGRAVLADLAEPVRAPKRPEPTGAIVAGTDSCTCGHAPEEHGREPTYPGSTACRECPEGDCIAYEELHEDHYL